MLLADLKVTLPDPDSEIPPAVSASNFQLLNYATYYVEPFFSQLFPVPRNIHTLAEAAGECCNFKSGEKKKYIFL